MVSSVTGTDIPVVVEVPPEPEPQYIEVKVTEFSLSQTSIFLYIFNLSYTENNPILCEDTNFTYALWSFWAQ